MLISNQSHIINKILNSSPEDIGIKLFLSLKDKKKDNYYFSKEVNLSPKSTEFLITHIKNWLKKEQLKGEKGFDLFKYDSEHIKPDSLAYYTYFKEEKAVISEKIKLLNASFQNNELEHLNKGKLQIVRLNIKKDAVFFCFYKGTKTMTKYKALGFFRPDGLEITEENYLELGGAISFFWDSQNVYIANVIAFENVFDYKDHISLKSTKALEEIIKKDFFVNEEAKKIFSSKSSNAVYARGLAKLDKEVIDKIDELFVARVSELKIIYKQREKLKGDEKKSYISKIGAINDLLKYFDFEKEKIIILEDDSPKILLHFFQDKIAQKFLSRDFVFTNS